MFKYHVYLAGPFFNREQKVRMAFMKEKLIEAGLKVCDPQELSPVIVDLPESERNDTLFAQIYQGNIQGMKDSFAIIACLDAKDIGTAFEIGFFVAENDFDHDRLLVSFSFDEKKTNVMLSQAVDFHFTDPREFSIWLKPNLPAFKKFDRKEIFGSVFAQRQKTEE